MLETNDICGFVYGFKAGDISIVVKIKNIRVLFIFIRTQRKIDINTLQETTS
jgi:hypothetical protein